jgi:hypothetical protein
MPLTVEDVYRVVQQYGPIIPNSIKQQLEQPDPTMINVYLSQLKEQGKIFFTKMQLGTSMFAYTKEQIPKLEELQKHLDEKDERTAQLLKEKKVLQVSEQEPLVRVSLQEIKDFAKPIKVKTKTGEEIFYRYFLVSLEEAQEIIRKRFAPQQEPETKQTPQVQEEQRPTEQPRPQETENKDDIKPKNEEQTSLSEPEEIESDFGKQIETYCEKNNISIKHYEEIRKDSDIELVLEVPTAVGTITFFAKARNKKSSNDGDLAAAILKAKTHNLPALYLTTGDVTNKALQQPELQDITVIEIGS